MIENFKQKIIHFLEESKNDIDFRLYAVDYLKRKLERENNSVDLKKAINIVLEELESM